MKIEFKTSTVTFEAILNDTLTAKEIYENLPVQANVSTWGNEIYFDLGFKACAQGATMDLAIGDIAYWSQGKCLCVFFGQTPASSGSNPAPASPVVVVGKTNASPADLKQIEFGEKITVSRKD